MLQRPACGAFGVSESSCFCCTVRPGRPSKQGAAVTEVFEHLKASGKVGACGVSVRGGPQELEDALAALVTPGLDCLQLKTDLCTTGKVRAVLASAVERWVAVFARQPFAGGALLRPAPAPTVLAGCPQVLLRLADVSVVTNVHSLD
jgi:aryl-alcohol dehydrogenase-like predicted oxidoreductase